MARIFTFHNLTDEPEEEQKEELNWNSHPFHHVLEFADKDEPEDGPYPTTRRDLWMMMAGNLIRDKQEWWRKIEDDSIWEKWMQELSVHYENEGDVITEAMKNYVRGECRFIAQNYDANLGIADGLDKTFKSDCLIPPELKEELISNVAVLENVPEKFKDWHPNSDNKVLDLVHPSLYPLVYGKSRRLSPSASTAALATKRCLPYSCSGKIVARFSSPHPEIESEDFQWLPSEFSIDPETKQCKFTSYINNLHPIHHKKLYYTLEKILTRCFPIIEFVLVSLRELDIRRTEKEHPYKWYEGNEWPGPYPTTDEGIVLYNEWHRTRKPKMPEALPFSDEGRVNSIMRTGQLGRLGTFSALGKGQVIVKLANIELTPENPEYDGGGWHLEGMLNERIVASVIYYYSSENITENHLSFRKMVCAPDYEQSDDSGVKMVYGLENDEALNQQLGYIITKEDRVIAFPNLYQHKVSPFKLLDPTKRGHRKILCFFFVDPHYRILSTEDIAPQQYDWWREELLRIPRFGTLPGEIFEHILECTDWPMNMNEAREARLQLMNERGIFVENANEFFEREFSLCEH